MTPVLTSPRRRPLSAPVGLRLAAQLARDAAEALADETSDPRDAARYLFAADRLSAALDSPHAGRQRLLMASPAVTETSGRSRTLIEMIEMVEYDPNDDAYRFRLAKLLLRALVWQPRTFPHPLD